MAGEKKSRRVRRSLLLAGIASYLEFFLVALIIVLVSYFLLESELKRRALSSFQQQLTVYATEVNSAFQKIRTIGETFGTDERAVGYVMSPSFSQSDIWDLSVILRSITNAALSAPGIVDIDLYAAKSRTLLSTYYGYRKFDSPVQSMLRDSLYNTLLKSGRRFGVTFTPGGLYDSSGVTITLLSSIPVYSSIGVMAITFVPAAIAPARLNLIQRLVLEDSSGNSVKIADILPPTGTANAARDIRSDYQHASIPVFGGEFRIIGEAKSSLLFRTYRTVGDWLLAALGVALFICLAGAYFVIRSTNRVMRSYLAGISAKLLRAAPVPKNRRVEDDFEVLGNAIDSIVSKNKNYEVLFRERKRMLVENAVRNLFHGTLNRVPTIIQTHLHLKRSGLFYVAAIMLDQRETAAESADRLAPLVRAFAGHWGGCSTRMEFHTFAALVPVEKRSTHAAVVDSLESMRRTFERDNRLTITIGLSTICSSEPAIGNAYSEAIESVRRRVSLGGNRIIEASQNPEVNEANMFLSLEEGRVLAQKLRVDSEAEIFAYVKSILHTKVEQYRPEMFNAFLFYLASTIANVGTTLGASETGLIDRSIIEVVTSFGTLEERERYFLDLCRTVLSHREQERHRYKRLSVDIVCEYIRENFRKPLSLSIIADDLNMSVSYLSSLLRRELGENYAGYINGLRIDLAKRILLERPRSTVRQVSSEVGYDSEHTFIRNFRKKVGKSPTDWRNAELEQTRTSRDRGAFGTA